MALVAGDIIAAEDHNGTLKTILTRSIDRGHISPERRWRPSPMPPLALTLTGLVAVIAGTLQSGFNPLTDLSGSRSRRARRC